MTRQTQAARSCIRNQPGIDVPCFTYDEKFLVVSTSLPFEDVYRPSANWTFTAAWTHVETEYKDFNIRDVGNPGTYDRVLSGNAEGDFSGKEVANTPQDNGILSARYNGQMGEGWSY